LSAAWSWRWVGLGTVCGLVVEMGGAGHRVRPGRGGGWGWASCAAWSWRWMGLGTDHGTRAGHRPRHAKQWGWASTTAWGLGIDYATCTGGDQRRQRSPSTTPAAPRGGQDDGIFFPGIVCGLVVEMGGAGHRLRHAGWAPTTLPARAATNAGGAAHRLHPPHLATGRTMGFSFLATLFPNQTGTHLQLSDSRDTAWL
jgi:hypothetical protein